MKRNENFSWLRRSFEVKASCAIILEPPENQGTVVIGNDDDVDQMARNQAALAAQARARQAAGGIAQAHADQAYDRARQNAVGYVPPLLGHVPPPPPGYELPPLQRGEKK